MKNFKTLILLFVLALSSCKKNDGAGYGSTSVKGKVLTYGTSQGVPNANLLLYEVDYSGFYSAYSIISHTVTNPNGEYTFNFNALKDKGYEIEAKAYRHFELSQTQNSHVLSPGGENQIDIPLYGYAIGKFRLRNLSKAKEFDMDNMIDLQGNYAANNFGGVNIDTTIYRILRGTRVNKVHYYVVHDTMAPRSLEREFKFNDTTYIEIDY